MLGKALGGGEKILEEEMASRNSLCLEGCWKKVHFEMIIPLGEVS